MASEASTSVPFLSETAFLKQNTVKDNMNASDSHREAAPSCKEAAPEDLPVFSSGSVKVKLHTATEDGGNQAEVQIECVNPDGVVDKMLQSILDKFASQSFVSVEKGTLVYPMHTSRQVPAGASGASVVVNGLPVPGTRVGMGTVSIPTGCSTTSYHMPSTYTHTATTTHLPYQTSIVHGPNLCNGYQTTVHESNTDYPQQEMRNRDYEYSTKQRDLPPQNFEDVSGNFMNQAPQYQEYIRRVPKVEYIDVPRETIKYVPKIETKIVEQIVGVPSKHTTPVAQVYPVDTPFVVPRYTEKEVPVVMSQTIVPEIEESNQVLEVEVSKYIPRLVPVDVFVPVPINVPIKATQSMKTTESPTTNISPELMQQLIVEMNPHIYQLESFNSAQAENFKHLILQSEEQAKSYGLQVIPPVSLPLLTVEEQRKSSTSSKWNHAAAAPGGGVSAVPPCTRMSSKSSSRNNLMGLRNNLMMNHGNMMNHGGKVVGSRLSSRSSAAAAGAAAPNVSVGNMLCGKFPTQFITGPCWPKTAQHASSPSNTKTTAYPPPTCQPPRMGGGGGGASPPLSLNGMSSRRTSTESSVHSLMSSGSLKLHVPPRTQFSNERQITNGSSHSKPIIDTTC